jgi:1,4-alpha-glucan branching enzyme
MRGRLLLLLHAHLPFVRRPEHDRFLEESWFYEAVTEVYLPLLARFRRLRDERVPLRLALSLSPTLVAMLHDPLLGERWRRRHEALIELAEQEIIRHHWQPAERELARGYAGELRRLLALWDAVDGDLPAAFADLERGGCLELLTTSATHAVLPLLAGHSPESVRAQVEIGLAEHERVFGRRPTGFWLPECAWSPELGPVLRKAGVAWLVVETHGLMQAGAAQGVFAPVRTPDGLHAFAREPTSAQQVWSRAIGYPGDPRYRDFHHDLGYEGESEYLRPYQSTPVARGPVGLRYRAVTGGSGPKTVYDPRAAQAAVAEHARHFVAARVAQVRTLAGKLPQSPVFLCPYDAELFGHWWHEGPDFLEAVVRLVAKSRELELRTPGEVVAAGGEWQTCEPMASTWGKGGHLGVWLGPENEWIQRALAEASPRLPAAIRRFAGTPEKDRILRQAANELLLAQASDWPFILHTGTSPGYATSRVRDHLESFCRLLSLLEPKGADSRLLSELELRGKLFSAMSLCEWV